MIIELTAGDAHQAVLIGLQRHASNQQAGRQEFNGAGQGTRSSPRIHVAGVLGEIAVARALGLPFDPAERVVYRRDSDDLAPGLEVRTRTRRHYDELYVHEKDRPGLIYVLAKLDAPTPDEEGAYDLSSRIVEIAGWISSQEAMLVRRRVNFGKPNWACHQRHLHPIDELPQLDL